MKPNRDDARHWPDCGHPRDPRTLERECRRCKRLQVPLALDDARTPSTMPPPPAVDQVERAAGPGLAKVLDFARARARRAPPVSVSGGIVNVDVFSLAVPGLGDRRVEVIVPQSCSIETRAEVADALRLLASLLEVASDE